MTEEALKIPCKPCYDIRHVECLTIVPTKCGIQTVFGKQRKKTLVGYAYMILVLNVNAVHVECIKKRVTVKQHIFTWYESFTKIKCHENLISLLYICLI